MLEEVVTVPPKGRRGVTSPTPPALKLLEGRAPGRDSGGRPVGSTPGYVRDAPDAPESLYGEARDEWDRVVGELARLELAKPIDRASLAAYCLTWQRLTMAQAHIDEHGLFSATSQGVGVAPAVRIVEAASKELRAWAQEFGLTPSAENRVTRVEGASGDDDGDGVFAGSG